MSDENTTSQSGSRWEPRTDASGAPTPPPVTPAGSESGDAAPAAPAAGSAPQPEGTGRPAWAPRARARGGLLAGAAALVLVAGVGGFAVSEVAHRHDGDRAPFGIGYQPQDVRFPAPPPGLGGDDDGGRLGGQPGAPLGGQPGGGDDDGAQQGSSL